jgi:hypothetical protein
MIRLKKHRSLRLLMIGLMAFAAGLWIWILILAGSGRNWEILIQCRKSFLVFNLNRKNMAVSWFSEFANDAQREMMRDRRGGFQEYAEDPATDGRQYTWYFGVGDSLSVFPDFDEAFTKIVAQHKVTYKCAVVVVPNFVLSILLFLPVSFTIVRFCRNKFLRRPAHACSTCGYDLTGNTSGVCPECGQTCST